MEGADSTASARGFERTVRRLYSPAGAAYRGREPTEPGPAVCRYGRGIVLAVGDPWVYNEYTNGRLPKGYENDKAVNDLAQWLVQQIPEKY